MKTFALGFSIFLILANTGGLKADCNALVFLFFACQDNTNPTQDLQVNEALFNQSTESVSSFEEAMNFFRSIVTQTESCDPQSPWCKCFKTNAVYYLPYNFSYFFLDPTIFIQMTSLLESIKIQVPPVYSDSSSSPIWSQYRKNSAISEFCRQYEFTDQLLRDNSLTRNCYAQSMKKLRSHDVKMCLSSYLDTRFSQPDPSFLNPEQTSKLVSCLVMVFANCSLETKRLFVLDQLYDMPQAIENKSDLIGSIDSIIQAKLNLTLDIILSSLVNGIVNSFKQAKQNCQFSQQKNLILDSTGLKIDGRWSLSNGHSRLEEITVELILDNSTKVTYKASVDDFPKAFDSNNTTKIFNSKNEIWLEMSNSVKALGPNAIEIVEPGSHVAVALDCSSKECRILVLAPDYLYQNAAGILVNGCPQFENVAQTYLRPGVF